jgi:hypothetical protein
MDTFIKSYFRNQQSKKTSSWIGIQDWEMDASLDNSGDLCITCIRVNPVEYAQEVRITFKIEICADDKKKYLRYKHFTGKNLIASGYTYELMTVIERLVQEAINIY